MGRAAAERSAKPGISAASLWNVAPMAVGAMALQVMLNRPHSAAALRGIETEADVLLKGTRVDGIYTADPEKDPAAVKFDEITFEEVLARRLKVMDLTAFTLCRENGLRIIVFDMDTAGNLGKVLAGEKIGTLVKL